MDPDQKSIDVVKAIANDALADRSATWSDRLWFKALTHFLAFVGGAVGGALFERYRLEPRIIKLE